jgi:predicted RecB family nuclease
VVLPLAAAAVTGRGTGIDDPMLEILRERGLEHERAYVENLAQSGRRVVEIDKQNPTAFEETLSAMRDGADVVVQARLEHGAWAGWADVLLRVAGESRFGGWRYEPVETKLAKETRGATLIQLCLFFSVPFFARAMAVRPGSGLMAGCPSSTRGGR